ncbi:MAG: hypothetical protein JWR21_867 [Herminiimonas sp.]|nr:hypothetical protein [Herminiimonas sp.]
MITIKPKGAETGIDPRDVTDTEAERFLINGLRRLNDDTMDFLTRFVELRLSKLPKRPSLRVIAGGAR